MSKIKILFEGTNIPVYADYDQVKEELLYEGTNVPVPAVISDGGIINYKTTNMPVKASMESLDTFTGLTLTAAQANSTVKLTKTGTPAWTGKYSLDNIVWKDYTFDTVITLANIGDRVYFKGDITADFSISKYIKFVMTGKIAASGNINSMHTSENFDELTTLTYKYCYQNMFYDCTSLITAPELPATTLIQSCYSSMFYGCASLVNAPALPAITLVGSCYQSMFAECTSLETIPALPATTLASQCYNDMFDGCTKIKMAVVESADYPNKFEFGADPTDKASDMFLYTGGTFTGDPTTTVYYTANEIVA